MGHIVIRAGDYHLDVSRPDHPCKIADGEKSCACGVILGYAGGSLAGFR